MIIRIGDLLSITKINHYTGVNKVDFELNPWDDIIGRKISGLF